MSAKRAFYIMLGCVLLLVVLCVFGTYFAHKKLVAEGNTLLDLKLQNAVLDKQGSSLAQAKRDIAQYQELETIAKTIVPQEKDQAGTTLALINLAKESGISITSIEFPQSQLGEAAKKSTGTSSSGNTSTNNNQSSATTNSDTTQLTPVSGLKGVYVMEIRVQSDKDRPIRYEQLLDYLRRLEKNRRTAQVQNISITPDTDNRNLLSFSLVLNSYVKP